MRKIILAALILRLVVALLGEHGDVFDYYWWSRDLLNHGLLGFYDRNIANATRPTYPPVTSYLFLLSAFLHEVFWKLNWFLNINISFYPSQFIFWIESEKGWFFFNKLPAIFSDIGIIFLLYKFLKGLGSEKAGKLAGAMFAFTPAFWYNSSLWGQTESVFALPMLGAFYALYKDKFKLAALLYGLAILTKPTAIFPLPVFAFWFFKKTNFKEIFIPLSLVFLEVIVLYLPFHPQGLLAWIFRFYQYSLGGELDYLVANAFNFWALIFGFDNRPDTSLFLGVPANLLGYIVFVIFVAFFAFRVYKTKKINIKEVLLVASILSFAAFLILPRMHDRYFYPTLVLLIPLAAVNKQIRKVFYALSSVHLINLYHFWWFPRIEILVKLFSNFFVEKALIAINISLFILLVRTWYKDYAKGNTF